MKKVMRLLREVPDYVMWKRALLKIESLCESMERDCQEGDKVRCHSQAIRLEIAKVYPKYLRS